jgi:hypothetical protein
MRYNELYRKYEPHAAALCSAMERLLLLPQYSMLARSYDAHSAPYVKLETALAEELEKVVRHG